MKWNKMAMALAAMAAAANAQVSTKGKWTPGTAVSRTPKALVVAQQDNEVLLAKEDGSHGGFQFAEPIDVKATPQTHGLWTNVAGGRVWTLPVVSRGAKSLSVMFDKFDIPEGAEMYVYNGAKTLGAYTRKNVKAHGKFSVQPLDGDSLTIELFVPTGAAAPSISLFKVGHGYKLLGYNDSGRCNNDVACPETAGWEGPIRAAGMLLTQFNSRYCSGSLINTVNNSGRQLFLTAAHCIGGSVANDIVMFNYESPECTPRTDGPTTDTVQGLTNLAAYAASDYTLLEIQEEIPSEYNVFLSGFNAVNETSTNVYGIHHPSGDVKKFSIANKEVVYTFWNEIPNRYHWEVPSWDDGTTEPGSSGSPLYDSNQRIIGQLHGGAASCTLIDYDSYGAVWASWDRGTAKLQTFLDPANTGVRIADGIDLNRARAMRQ